MLSIGVIYLHFLLRSYAFMRSPHSTGLICNDFLRLRYAMLRNNMQVACVRYKATICYVCRLRCCGISRLGSCICHTSRCLPAGFFAAKEGQRAMLVILSYPFLSSIIPNSHHMLPTENVSPLRLVKCCFFMTCI